MNAVTQAWALEPFALTWFVTTMVQVTLLASLVLTIAWLARKDSVVRHSILAIGMLLIVVSPISTCCLQLLGYGIVTIPSDTLTTVESERAADFVAITSTSIAPTTQPTIAIATETFAPAAASAQVARPGDGSTHEAPLSSPDLPMAANPVPVAITTPVTTGSAPTVMGSLRALLACLLAVSVVGSLLLSLRWLVTSFHLRKIVRSSIGMESPLVQCAFRDACYACDVTDKFDSAGMSQTLRSSELIRTPMVVGIFKPTILVPHNLSQQVSRQQMTEILLHELAHIVRRDPLILFLQNLARTLFWMHPLVHWIARMLTRASEEICDNYVLKGNSTYAYSRTLLAVAKLGLGERTPTGAIGVVGSGFTLAARIAGMLDKQRLRTTSMRRQTKLVMLALAVGLSLNLLATVRFSDSLATAAQLDPPAQTSPTPSALNNTGEVGVRGSGDTLEFRLHGRLLGGEEGPPIDPQLEVVNPRSNQKFPLHISGDRYEVWLPVKAFKWLQLSIQGSCRDGRRANVSLYASRLRTAIEQGVDIQFQRPSRIVKFQVQTDGRPTPGAHVQIKTSLGDSIARTDANGQATFNLRASEELSACTSWTDTGLLGGFQFHQMPKRDRTANEHSLELFECEPRKIVVVDAEGSPVPGLRLQLDVATPPPSINYLGKPEGYEVTTDATGTASYAWVPKWKEIHLADAILLDKDWIFQSQTNRPDRIELVVSKPGERVPFGGVVSRGGDAVGGMIIEAYSFQGESEDRSDVHYVMTDSEGKFLFQALPKSTYCIFAHDDRLVSESCILPPIDPETGRENSATLSVFEGHPVTVALTSGTNRRPIVGQSVALVAEYPYSWKEEGKLQNGSTSRQTFATTNEQGVATAFAPAGTLKASVYTSGWRAEKKIKVASGQENRIELHRANDSARPGAGRLMTDKDARIDWSAVKVSLQSVDGENSDRLTPKVAASGEFRFETEATALACYAISADGSWAGATLVRQPDSPFELLLHPTTYLEGQLLDEGGKGIAQQTIRAIPVISGESTFESGSIGFPRRMEVPAIEAKTDAEGKYRIGPLPRLTPIRLQCKLDSGSEEDLGKLYIELNEQRPPQIDRLGETSPPAPTLTVTERMNAMLRDARLGGYHAMAILADYSDKSCSDFVDEELLDYDNHPKVGSYMQMRFKAGPSASEQGLAYIKQRGWPLPAAGQVTAIAMNAAGQELARAIIDVADPKAKDEAARFVEAHLPPPVDAKQKWEAAFALAKQTNRRVWVRISQRYCEPCHVLNRWLDEHRETLDKEFVMLKIDDVRDLNGQDVATKVTQGHLVGVPFFAFFDANEKMLIDSVSPVGNIGAISGYEGKRHFRKMLDTVKQVISEADVKELIDSL